MPRTLKLAAALLIAACASQPTRTPKSDVPPAPAPARNAHPLANLAARRIIVTPVYDMVQGDPLGWAAGIPRPRAMLRELDSAITAEFRARGLGSTWYFAPQLEQSYQLNSTYAADPHMLAENPLRGHVEIGKNYGEPLATQLRTMIAMQDGARLVMLPVELRFERVGAGTQGQAVLKLVLVDARTTEFVWSGEVKSEPASAFGPVVFASLANRFADLVISP